MRGHFPLLPLGKENGRDRCQQHPKSVDTVDDRDISGNRYIYERPSNQHRGREGNLVNSNGNKDDEVEPVQDFGPLPTNTRPLVPEHVYVKNILQRYKDESNQ